MNSMVSNRASQRGVTMIELLIGIAVASIVMALAVPSFREASRNAGIRSATIDLVAALNAARAQAVNFRTPISVQPIDGANWNSGYLIDYPVGFTEQDTSFPINGLVQVVEVGGNNSVTFAANGIADNALTFQICDDRAGERGRQLDLSKVGRVSTAEFACP